MNTVVVSFDQEAKGRPIIADALGGAAEVIYLTDLDDQARAKALREATALLGRNTAKELRPHEPALLESAKLIQFINAGVDFVPLKVFPDGVPIASNGGAYAEPMAEHALAMTFAAAKRLLIEHNALIAGAFNQRNRNRMLSGMTCGILGMGGIGEATARLMRAMGMKIHAINRRGASAEPTDWFGTPADLDQMLAVSDVLVICTPLSPQTMNWIGARELGLMKRDAILVNLARGEIIVEDALFAHLQANPHFTACLDAWWIEPVRHGRFGMAHPFLSLPNVIGSPHNSASVPGTGETGLRRAIANIKRAFAGEPPLYLIGADERMM